jgi:hypothetical protein
VKADIFLADMLKRPVTQIVADSFASLTTRTKQLLGLWGFFLLLVVFGIHGSATGVTAGWWAPEKPYTGYLFNPPQSF